MRCEGGQKFSFVMVVVVVVVVVVRTVAYPRLTPDDWKPKH